MMDAKPAPTLQATREEWLNAMAALMEPRFVELGFPLQPFRVSIGFTSRGARSNSAAEVWHSKVSADGKYEIFIMPDQVEPNLLCCHLAHELTHVAVGFDQGHTKNFAKVAMALGMNRPMTATTPGPEFAKWVAPFLEKLGPIPHGNLSFDRLTGLGKPVGKDGTQDKGAGGEDGGEGDDDGPIVGGRSTGPKKQTARLLKCECSKCGYVVRVARRWLDDIGPPHCPNHGAMDTPADE